jgi:D-alanyl-D-alanine carboxypeptidase/D-alanyl-D-alanine carboxypeptidase (penicillin-binding protein 5/6)
VKKLHLAVSLLLTSLFVAPTIKAEADSISLHSETAILMDAKSGQVLFEKEINELMYPASITKIVTAIIAIEQGNLDEIVTVSQKARNVIGTRVYLLENEKVELLKLVQGLLINSGNDAGTAIAEHIAGSEERFAEKMNDFVKEKIGVTNTNFVNPHGLFDENHITTAYDMAKITQYAMQNETFREIVGTKEMEWIGEGWETIIYNHHRLLWRYEGVTGVKNGYVSQSGYTLVTTAIRGDTEYIVVTLNAPSAEHAYSDTKILFDYGFEQYETQKIEKNRLFKADNGTQFELEEALYFVTKKEEDSLIEISNSGRLSIKTKDKDLITSTMLTRIESDPENKLTANNQESNQRLNETEEENQTLFIRLITQLMSFLQIR